MEDAEQFIANLTQGDWLAKIIVAAAILVAVAIVSHLITKWMRHVMSKDDNPLPQSTIFVNIMRLVVWGLGICFVLDACFGVNATAIIAALGVGGIAISLGFQDTLSNLIGGTQISFMRIVQPGDNIKVSGYEGVVQDVTWRHATIRTRTGDTVIVPNSVISKNAVVHMPPPEHVVVHFSVSAAGDMEDVARRVADAARTAASGVATVTSEPRVLFTTITEEGSTAKVILDVDDPAKEVPVIDAVTRAISPIVRA